MLLSEGQMSDFKGAALMLRAMPGAKALLADSGYDADWFRRGAREARDSRCIPSEANRKAPFAYDAVLYSQRHRIENMFARLKRWATRRTPDTTVAPTPTSRLSASPQPASLAVIKFVHTA